MESSLKTKALQSDFREVFCFNPCFNGILSQNEWKPKEIQVSLWVSILVLMESSLKTQEGIAFLISDAMFQSLF